MDSYHLCLTTANIHFSNLYWFEKRGFYVFDITFENTTDHLHNNLVYLAAGFDQDSAQNFLEALKQYFASAGIYEDSRVHILFSGEQVLAIGANGKDLWIDVRRGVFFHTFPKSFSTLGIEIKSLEVY